MRVLTLLSLSATLLATVSAVDPPTAVHKPGYCALRSTCGKKSFFGGELPCPYNGLAELPTDDVRDKLVAICGDAWADTPVCCDEKQLSDLRSNLKRVEPLISSCPACKANFFNLFCTFTCSPDQSLFLNVTRTDKSTSGKDIIAEVDYFVSEDYGSGFYNSCKDVKYSVTNGNAMDLIGGGAKDYPAFLKFLGDKKAFGSPFQMNFPGKDIETPPTMERMDTAPKRCDGDDINYRCSCVDCPATCPRLPTLKKNKSCKVGHVPCISLIAVTLYAAFLFILVSGYAARLAWFKSKENKRGRTRLLHEAQVDEDDEGGLITDVTSWDIPPREYKLNTWLDKFFSKLGGTCASYPALTIGVSLLVVGLMSLGWLNFTVETDPVRLWVSPTSEAAKEKAFFDEKFGPFYRTQQAFLVNDTTSDGPAPVLSYETLHWWFDVEERVKRIQSPNYQTTLGDLCFRPTDEGCVIQSISGYFQGAPEGLKPTTWASTLKSCASMPVQSQCLPDFGQPIKKELVLGGYEETGNILDSKALIVTWVVNNWADETSEEIKKAMDWENTMRNLMVSVQDEARERGLRLSFSTEVSLEQELNKSTNTDAKIVVISYIAMFIYASIALGGTSFIYYGVINDPKFIFVDSKFTLGISGILIVLMSVSASVGIFSAMGIKVTLIIAEVIPFLVLAIGVDNIFLIVHEFDKVNSIYGQGESVESRIAVALGKMGPSILLSALTEFIAFALGSAVTMPAVRNFAIYAAGAVLINAILQVTMFIAVLALNQKRLESSRVDCFPCIKVRESECREEARSLMSGQPINGSANGWPRHSNTNEGIIDKFVRKKYALFLLGKRVQVGVVIVFLGLLTAGVSLLPKVALGLDQRIALPSDSYLIDYFNDLDGYLRVGPPVYFVTKEYNVTSRHGQKALCGRFSTCDKYSLANVLEQERKRSEVSYIAEPAASWIDDYFLWLDPALETCCSINKRTGKLCGENTPARQCQVCFADRQPAWNITLNGMPEGKEFMNYLKTWLDAPTGEACPLAGKAGYSHAVVPNYEDMTIEASHFRTSHLPLRSQDDFIKAYAQARRISRTISKKTGAPVFPYSKFYIFFDQYANIQRLTLILISAALVSICVVAAILLGSIRTALVVTFTVAMIVIDVMGCMALFGVSLNAVSLVNLVIAVGISVEFCSHIARAFQFPTEQSLLLTDPVTGAPASRFNSGGKPVNTGTTARAYSALVSVGGSVFTGITLTKFLGVSVLAFTRSKIFEIYYFRMWVSLVVVGAAHALIWLPVALSIAGGDGWAQKELGGEADDLRRRIHPTDDSDEDFDSDDEDASGRGRARGR